jgi:hypothetical protein
MLSSLQSGFQLILGLVADTSFVLASKPPHTANASEIEKDNQPIIDRSISSVHLFSSVVVYGLAVAQYGSQWTTNGKFLGDHAWGEVEWAGVGAMIFGGSLRLWCYRTLGQFFTFNVSLLAVILCSSSCYSVGNQKGQWYPSVTNPNHAVT